MRASASLLTLACVSLAARGERITTTAVWSYLEQRCSAAAVSRGLRLLEERGVLRRVRRATGTYAYALAAEVAA